MRTVKEALELSKERRKSELEIIRFVKFIKDDLEKYHIFINNNDLSIFIKSHELHECRKMLKKHLTDYKDKLSRIDGVDKEMVYKSVTKPLIYIYVRYNSLDDMPKSIYKNGKCGFEEIKEKHIEFVCNIKELIK